jgi:thiamine biosynthesis lipoprotein
MRETKHIMGMHVTVEIRDAFGSENKTPEQGCNLVFDYLTYIDETFSTYKDSSEISKINRGEISESEYSSDMTEIMRLAQLTNEQTQGYFNINQPSGGIDPSGVVKGWAIWQASLILQTAGFNYFYIDVGGDIQTSVPEENFEAPVQNWRAGIRNPFNVEEIVKVVELSNQGMATSGSYERGQHIYNPLQPDEQLNDVVSITVLGPNIYEADRFATAAFAMGRVGIEFIEAQPNLEGYQIDRQGMAIQTSNFEDYVTV